MQHETNAQFVQSIEHNLEGIAFFSVGACPGCEECGLDHIKDADDDSEAYDMANEADEFSMRPCQSCGSTLGGSRHPAHGFIDGELTHFRVCQDCAMFHANGEYPFDDETMDG